MNNTTITVVTILAAAALMAGVMVITPAAYANDGNTHTHQNNKHKTIASGFLTVALNEGSNCVSALSGTCTGGILAADSNNNIGNNRITSSNDTFSGITAGK
jgi:hypothetical protein